MDGSTIADETASKATTSVARTFFPFTWTWYSVVALTIFVPASLRIADGDIWVHLRNAKELIEHRSFLHADLYTFTTAGAPLINFEWLSELPYYFAFTLWEAGYVGRVTAWLDRAARMTQRGKRAWPGVSLRAGNNLVACFHNFCLL